ncbi:MAG: hypothetical protein, partial [Olavius algarvensis Gamma 1 endosymbiont]
VAHSGGGDSLRGSLRVPNFILFCRHSGAWEAVESRIFCPRKARKNTEERTEFFFVFSVSSVDPLFIYSCLPSWFPIRQSVAVLGMRNGTSQSPFRPALGRQLVRAADA